MRRVLGDEPLDAVRAELEAAGVFPSGLDMGPPQARARTWFVHPTKRADEDRRLPYRPGNKRKMRETADSANDR